VAGHHQFAGVQNQGFFRVLKGPPWPKEVGQQRS